MAFLTRWVTDDRFFETVWQAELGRLVSSLVIAREASHNRLRIRIMSQPGTRSEATG